MRTGPPPAEVVAAVNRAWRDDRLADLASLLHPRVAFVGPDLSRWADGREACIASYRDFLAAATVYAFEEREVRAEDFGATAVVSYAYRVVYESGGARHDEQGREVLVLVRAERTWQVAWRQVLP